MASRREMVQKSKFLYQDSDEVSFANKGNIFNVYLHELWQILIEIGKLSENKNPSEHGIVFSVEGC